MTLLELARAAAKEKAEAEVAAKVVAEGMVEELVPIKSNSLSRAQTIKSAHTNSMPGQ